MPAAFYPWGTLAFTTPLLEQTSVFNALNFSFPGYVRTSTFPGTGIAPPNTTVVGPIVGPLARIPATTPLSAEKARWYE